MSLPKILMVGCGAIGGVIAANYQAAGGSVVVLLRSEVGAAQLRRDGVQLWGLNAKLKLDRAEGALAGVTAVEPVSVAELPRGNRRGAWSLRKAGGARHPADEARQLVPTAVKLTAVEHEVAAIAAAAPSSGFQLILLATQPTQLLEAARRAAPLLAPDGYFGVVQNGLCEDLLAEHFPKEQILGAVVAWGATRLAPGVMERTSVGGFIVGGLVPPSREALDLFRAVLLPSGPVRTTSNLRGARWSKLAANAAISTLGTLGGRPLGELLRLRRARRLGLDLMSEALRVALAEGVRLESLAGVPLERFALAASPQRSELVLKHAAIFLTGLKYRRLRSSMLRAIEAGEKPPIEFLNGEVVRRGEARGLPVEANRLARRMVWEISEGKRTPSLANLTELYGLLHGGRGPSRAAE